MQLKNTNVLPKTLLEIGNGGLYIQAVRCGKKTCRCATGDLHTGYHYFLFREGGRLRKRYVRKAEVAEFEALVKSATAQRRAYRESLRMSKRRFTELNLELRTIAADRPQRENP
jgi:hypothetical protein